MRDRGLKAAGILALLFLFPFGCRPTVPESKGRSASHPPEDPPFVAFVVYDAGETLALLPVAERLRDSRIRVQWVPLTPWAADLLQANGQTFLELPEGVSEMAHVDDRWAVSETGYWEEALARDLPSLAVSGMVSRIQGRLAYRLRGLDVPTRGFYDGFQPPDPGAIGMDVAPRFDEIWASTERVRTGFVAEGFSTMVAGQPTLETWRRTSDRIDRQEVRRRQGLPPSARVLLFAGQYGPGYEEALTSFLVAVRRTLFAGSSLHLVLSHHPRTEGGVERRALDRSPLPRAHLAADGLSTAELATIADVVITWTSTVAVQAAFMGKTVVYYSPPPGFDTVLVGQGAAFLSDEASLDSLLQRVLEEPRNPDTLRKALVEAGYVVGADSVVAEMIREAIGKGE